MGTCRRLARAHLLLLVLCAFLFVAPRSASAGGWQEVHQTSDDVRIVVGPDGQGTVTHHLRYRVVAGRFKSFELAGIDSRAELVRETVVLPEKGDEIAGAVELDPKVPGTVRVTFDAPKGLGRGSYVVDVKYRIDFVGAKLLMRDSAMWQLAWTAPPAPEGHDGARVVFELPPAPTEPRLFTSEAAMTTLATLRRSAAADELELVRPHVPRGEAVTWSIRVDPKAFAKLTSNETRVAFSSARHDVAIPSHATTILTAALLAALAGALAFGFSKKQEAATHAARARLAEPRPLVRLPWGIGPFVFAALAIAGFAELLWDSAILGAALVVFAMIVATHRSPVPMGRPRGPGRWHPIADERVFRRALPAEGDFFDLSSNRGKGFALSLWLVLAVVTWILSGRIPGIVVAAPLASAALIPLFVTGTRRQLPPTAEELATRMLAPARDALAKLVDLAHVDLRCIARFREGQKGDIDEVRLECVPAEPVQGLRAIELAVATSKDGQVSIPEILVRFDDGSGAASKLADLARGAPVVPGRSIEEKVQRLVPRVPTAQGAARLLSRLVQELEGRRASDRKGPALAALRYAGPERRGSLLSAAAST